MIRVALLFFALAALPSWSQGPAPPAPALGQPSKDSIWVPTPERLVRRMLQMADTTKDDVVIDLGAGDGRIPIYAAKHFGAFGIATGHMPAWSRRASERTLSRSSRMRAGSPGSNTMRAPWSTSST